MGVYHNTVVINYFSRTNSLVTLVRSSRGFTIPTLCQIKLFGRNLLQAGIGFFKFGDIVAFQRRFDRTGDLYLGQVSKKNLKANAHSYRKNPLKADEGILDYIKIKNNLSMGAVSVDLNRINMNPFQKEIGCIVL